MTDHRSYFAATALLVAALAAGCGPGAGPRPAKTAPVLSRLSTGTDVLFIGLHVLNPDTVWLAGTGATWARTTDGGQTWRTGTVSDAATDSLQFRDVHAFDAETALLLSIGSGTDSRIYRTEDGGASWQRTFQNSEPAGFFDCFDFWDHQHGIAFSDVVDDRFYLAESKDGGQSWSRFDPSRLPATRPGEGSFAASGTCLLTHGDSTAWFGTAAGGRSVVVSTADRGRTWTVAPTTIRDSTSTSGVATLAFLDDLNGIVAGGDVAANDTPQPDAVAITHDGGRSWTRGGTPPFAGGVYGSSVVPGMRTPTFVITGPGGAGYSYDGGMTWNALDTLSHWTAGFASGGVGYLAGPGGRVTRVTFR